MFGVCPLFTPTFRNSRLHPNVWGFVLFSPQRFYHAELAAMWTPRQQLTGRRSHVATMSAQGKTKEIVAGREDNGGERWREGGSARGSESILSILFLIVDGSILSSSSLSRHLPLGRNCFLNEGLPVRFLIQERPRNHLFSTTDEEMNDSGPERDTKRRRLSEASCEDGGPGEKKR